AGAIHPRRRDRHAAIIDHDEGAGRAQILRLGDRPANEFPRVVEPELRSSKKLHGQRPDAIYGCDRRLSAAKRGYRLYATSSRLSKGSSNPALVSYTCKSFATSSMNAFLRAA